MLTKGATTLARDDSLLCKHKQDQGIAPTLMLELVLRASVSLGRCKSTEKVPKRQAWRSRNLLEGDSEDLRSHFEVRCDFSLCLSAFPRRCCSRRTSRTVAEELSTDVEMMTVVVDLGVVRQIADGAQQGLYFYRD